MNYVIFIIVNRKYSVRENARIAYKIKMSYLFNNSRLINFWILLIFGSENRLGKVLK